MPNLATRRPPEAHELVRTVLFSDVVASTELIDRRGEAAWLSLIDRHARAVCALAERHGGEVVSFLGDGFMLMFAEPSDAVNCAIRLQTASRIQNLVRIRIGLDHGQVLHYREGWYVGRTIHVAARLADLCDDDEIVVSERCMDHARRGMAAPATQLRCVSIRGMSEPSSIHVLRPSDNT